jgi:2-C-methyl-D-erythritol 2,4-cyclodiphosphate synthase
VRIGTGFDAHRLVPGRPLVLGGVTIPHGLGLEGHSDGDALTHAVIDALLGAAALGDIGGMFGSDDPELEGADSLELLSRVGARLGAGGWRVENVDTTVVAQAPRLSPHRDAMRERLAAALGIEPDRVSVKATTTDRLGPWGREEGVAAYAACLIERDGR